jgi:hypothetical protein
MNIKYDYLKTRRWIWFLDNNINAFLLIILWVNKFKTAFWILLVMSVLQLIGIAIVINKEEKDLGLRE